MAQAMVQAMEAMAQAMAQAMEATPTMDWPSPTAMEGREGAIGEAQPADLVITSGGSRICPARTPRPTRSCPSS